LNRLLILVVDKMCNGQALVGSLYPYTLSILTLNIKVLEGV
jgi:hypothetical protein